MLVEEATAELVGYLSPPDVAACFIVPLFRRRESNMLLVQESGTDDRVVDFRAVEPREMRAISTEDVVQHQLGAPTLWGFRTAAGETSFGERAALRHRLLPLIDGLDEPFLKLQVAQFCEREEDLVGAWRAAYRLLADRSPRSAAAWRDVVVLPTQMRLAVENVALSYGLDASIQTLARSVELDLTDDHVGLRLDRALHAALSTHPAARRALERDTRAVRHAFNLKAGRLSLAPLPSTVGDEEAPVPGWERTTLVAIGDMAITFLTEIAPMPVRRSARDGNLPSFLVTDVPAIAVVHNGRTPKWLAKGEIERIDGDGEHTLLVMFELDAGQKLGPIIDQAVHMAEVNRRKGRKIVAVIPHFPEMIAQDQSLADDLVHGLEEAFDAIWALSDRSPYTRQGLAYGPARSLKAAATHFMVFLALLRAGKADGSSIPKSPRPGAKWSVIGSAIGERSLARLTDHALMRLSHHLFDFTPVQIATILYDGTQAVFEGDMHAIIHRDAPDARVIVNAAGVRRPGPDRVILAMQGVGIIPAGPEHFEIYCGRQLQKHGWDVQRSPREFDMQVSRRDIKNVAVECKFYREALSDNAIRARVRRSDMTDSVLVTNAPIRRSVFARNVLHGIVPIHSSRIDALPTIFRRRYAYALRMIFADVKDQPGLVLPAAYEVLNVMGLKVAKSAWRKLGPVLLNFDDARMYRHSDSIEVDFTLHLDREAVAKTGLPQAEAVLFLDGQGWRLASLSIGKRSFV